MPKPTKLPQLGVVKMPSFSIGINPASKVLFDQLVSTDTAVSDVAAEAVWEVTREPFLTALKVSYLRVRDKASKAKKQARKLRAS